MQDSCRIGFARDCLSAWRSIANAVVIKTSKTTTKYWGHWATYAATCGIDPFLRNTGRLESDVIVTAFAARVRTGVYGRGTQIRVSGVQDALASIATTCMLAGQQSPIHRTEEKYTLAIERLVEGYRRADPPSVPQLAVPITVPNLCFEAGMLSPHEHIRGAGHLCTIAFYFLLRVGEYTQARFIIRNGEKVRATRTRQFTVGNIGFFKNDKVVPRASPLETLLECDAATLKISNQKNGRMGQTIHQRAVDIPTCPIKALAYRTHHILSNGGDESSLICMVFDNNTWTTITSKDIITALRAAATSLKLQNQNIDPDLIGAHSLRSGGAMALKLHGYDDTTIRKMGRWTSDTFLQYIHNQIAHLSVDISQKMSIPLPFLNIAAIEQAPQRR
jgi:hypothetical protein